MPRSGNTKPSVASLGAGGIDWLVNQVSPDEPLDQWLLAKPGSRSRGSSTSTSSPLMTDRRSSCDHGRGATMTRPSPSVVADHDTGAGGDARESPSNFTVAPLTASPVSSARTYSTARPVSSTEVSERLVTVTRTHARSAGPVRRRRPTR